MKKLIILLLLFALQIPLWCYGFGLMGSGGGVTIVGGCDNDCSGNYGETGAGGTLSNFTTYQTQLTRVALDCEGTNPTIYAYLSNSSAGTKPVHFVIYNDDAAGEPSTLLWSGDVTVDANETGAWYNKVSSIACLNDDASGYVYIGVQAIEDTVSFMFTAGAYVARRYTSGSFTVESPWPHASDTHATAIRHFYLAF